MDFARTGELGGLAQNTGMPCLTNHMSETTGENACLNDRQHVGRVGRDEGTVFDPVQSSSLWKRCGMSEECKVSVNDTTSFGGDSHKSGRDSLRYSQDYEISRMNLPHKEKNDIPSLAFTGFRLASSSPVEDDGTPKVVSDLPCVSQQSTGTKPSGCS